MKKKAARYHGIELDLELSLESVCDVSSAFPGLYSGLMRQFTNSIEGFTTGSDESELGKTDVLIHLRENHQKLSCGEPPRALP